MIKDFKFSIPSDVTFGVGALKQLPAKLKSYNVDRVLVVSDRMLEGIGVVKQMEDILTEAGISYEKYLDCKPNPTIQNVEEAAAIIKENNLLMSIAIGGGSSMDTAKGAGIIAGNGGVCTDYQVMAETIAKVKKTIPTVCIPTTAGTGSECSISAVITNEETKYKMSMVTPLNIPKLVILDPNLITTVPAGVAAACGMDALVHAIEAYLSRIANPFSDAFAEKAMELIGKYIRRFVGHREDMDAACAMMVASNFAGIAFSSALLGNVHALSQPVSANYGVSHGNGNALLLPYVLDFNKIADHDGRYKKIYDYVRTTTCVVDDFVPEMLVAEIFEMNKQLGVPMRLREVGVEDDSRFDKMVEDAIFSRIHLVNPRKSGAKELRGIYEAALDGEGYEKYDF